MARSILFQPSSLSQPLFSIRAKFLHNSRQFHPISSNSHLSSLKPAKKTPLTQISAQAKRAFSSSKMDEFASPSDLQFKSPLTIIEYPDPILRAPNKKIREFDENLKKLVDEMFDIMYKTDGIGLAAPQVGINVRLMVFNSAGERGVGEEIVLVNPRISKFSRKLVLFEEGCLSFPEIYADVERPESVKIDAQDINGAKFSSTLSALPARVFQHEFDHLQGTLFVDRMTEEVVGSIRAMLQALEKKYEDANGVPSPEKVDTSIGRREVAGFGRS